MSIEMSMTTDHTEIRNSADDDVRSDPRVLRSDPVRMNTYLNAISDLGMDYWVKLSTRVAIALAVMAVADAESAALTAERDAYRKAKQENDERFQIAAGNATDERNTAQAEVARLRAGIEVERLIFAGLGLTGVVTRLDALVQS